MVSKTGRITRLSSITRLSRKGMHAMRWSELVEQVRERGQYATGEEAERITRTVLTALGGHLTGPERAELAHRLPREAAAALAGPIPPTLAPAASEFVDAVAARLGGATSATARWDVSSVLGAVAEMAGDELLDRLLSRLPSGYGLLFGRAELLPAGHV
ncbi:DUF2267 domain-containing protein [Streptomyces cuspidosporus]